MIDHPDYLVFTVLAPVAIAVLFVSIVSIRPYRSKPVVRSLVWYLWSVLVLLVVNTLELFSSGTVATLTWARMYHVALLATALSWFFFGMQYSRHRWFFVPRRMAVVFVVPILTMVILWTNSFHGLFWKETPLYIAGRVGSVRPVYGPWFWVNGIYIYILLLSGLIAILSTYNTNRPVYRKQRLAIMAGAILPIAFNLLYVFRVFPWLGKDYTPIAYALSGLFFYIGVHSFRLVRLLPVRHQLVLGDVLAAIVVIDPDGNIVDVNPAAESLFDKAGTGIIGKSWSETALGTVLSGIDLTERQNFETSVIQEQTVYLDVRVQPIRADSGKPAGTVVTISDVTAWNELVAEKSNALGKLHDEMARVGELQMQLRNQERLAIVGQLAANMAHEVNNPLVVVMSGFEATLTYLESAFDSYGDSFGDVIGAPPEEVSEMINDINSGLARISYVVDSMLRFSISSRQEDPRVAVCFDQIVEDALSLVRSTARDVPIETEIEKMGPVHCSPNEIGQVLVNLLINAIHSISQVASPRIEIRASSRENFVRCSVTDNGPGVPEEVRSRIFDPFFSTKKEGVGAGLGLSISRDIICNRHGGKLWLESALPAQFVFEIPFRG